MANKISTDKVCVVCGKPLLTKQQKLCSEECRKKWQTMYNSNYIKERRKVDEEFVEKNRKSSAISSRRGFATKQWNTRLEQADKILQLSKMDNARQLVAKYLDLNFEARMSYRSPRKYQSEEELEAIEVLESLGDVLTSN